MLSYKIKINEKEWKRKYYDKQYLHSKKIDIYENE